MQSNNNNNKLLQLLSDAQWVNDALRGMEIYNLPATVQNKYTTKSALELSSDHKLLLVFLRHFQCPFCQATIAKIASHYKTLLQLNTIPVFVHQETKEQAVEYFANYAAFAEYQPIVQQFFRVENLSDKSYYSRFHLGSVKVINRHVIQNVKKARKLRKLGFVHSFPPSDSRAITSQMPGMFIVENGKVTNAFEYKAYSDNPLFFDLIIDPREMGCTSDSVCDLKGRVKAIANPSANNGNTPTEPDSAKIPSLKEKDPYKIFDAEKKPKKKSNLLCTSASLPPQEIPEHMLDTITVTSILENTKSRKHFKLFCASETSVENVLFWESVQQFKTNGASDDLARQIMDTFFDVGSPNELNTSQRLITQTRNMFETDGPIPTLFDHLVTDILVEQLNDTFARFKRSEEFKTACRAIVYQTTV